MFRSSRYFIILFLLVNVFPIFLLILWDHHRLEQFTRQRSQDVLHMGSEGLKHLYTKHLEAEVKRCRQIIPNLPPVALTLNQYQRLSGAQYAWWIDGQDGHLTLTGNTGAPLPQQVLGSQFPTQITGDYIIYQDPHQPHPFLGTALMVPMHQGPHSGLLLIKLVPTDELLPHGPFFVEVYSGSAVDSPHLIATQVDPLMVHFHHLRDTCRHQKFILCSTPKLSPAAKLSPDFPKTMSRLIPLKNHQGQTVATLRISAPRPFDVKDMENKNLLFALLVLLTGVVSSGLAGSYMKKNFIDPLVRLSVTTQAVLQGDLQARVDTEAIKHAEVLRTVTHFNNMVGQLSETEQLRKNFITNLTHDLRTPLIAQERTLVMLAKEFENLKLSEQAKLAGSLAKNNEHLLTMVNQLLETYQFEAGQLNLLYRPIHLPELVTQCFDHLAALALEQNITLKNELPETLPTVQADLDCLKRVFLNLLGNALENIPKGSLITVGGQATPETVDIFVRDNGGGIPPEELESLFDRYAYKGDTRKIGSGLGLYICKMFVEAHNGTIGVRSEVGQFTEFRITLPIAPNEEESP